jgi:hypothetical protein
MRPFGYARILPSCFLTFVAAGAAVAGSLDPTTQANGSIYESYFHWMTRNIGLLGVLTVLAGVASFVAVSVIVFRIRHPLRLAGYFVMLPILVGILGAIAACVSTVAMVAQDDATMAPLHTASGVSACVRMLSCAACASGPSAIVLAVGAFVRMRRARKATKSGHH